jgi:predicted DCC family thiol-disulfide oxidoreductase YuxK
MAATGAERTSMADLTVLFDGTCNLCRGSAERVRRFDKAQHIEFLDLRDPAAQQRFPRVNREEAMRWMQAVDSDGKVFSGSDAWARIGRLLPGWKFVAWILLVPGIRWIAGKVYVWIARNRYRWNRAVCEDGSCRLHVEKKTSSRL